jgi:hypothetical protein
MRPSYLLNLGLVAAGAIASLPTLRRRHAWEQSNRRAFIVLDYDDALAVTTRAGLGLAGFLHEARHHGATHVSLPELTLARLVAHGRLVPTVSAAPLPPAPAGHWHFLLGRDRPLLEHLVDELSARVPASHPRLIDDGPVPMLAAAGDWPALAEVGLGFEAAAAAVALQAGLGLVPRPVSFAWPEAHLVERTLLQAAGLHAGHARPGLIAFEGDIILGHEMHLDATVDCLRRYSLHFAYFCETRHQKGDWFIAKRLAPFGQVVPAHYFTPAALVPEDFHSAAHHWGMLARQRGIRLCYVNVFRRIHATHPLECLHYLEHIKGELEGLGLQLGPGAAAPPPLAAPGRRDQALAGLAPAGAGALAVSATLPLSEPAALAVTAAAVAGAVALPYLDRPRGHLEEAYPPSYAPKLLALAGAALAPAAALAREPATAFLTQAGVAGALAALTTGHDYQMRVEQFRALNLDWVLPLAAAGLQADDPRLRWLLVAAVSGAWMLARTRTPDLLALLDRDLPAGHTHHLSAAQRLVGDALIALGPRPGRKWAGLGLAAVACAGLLRRRGRTGLALAASLTAGFANALALAAFRQPERPLARTLPEVTRSLAAGGTAALALAALSQKR